MVIVYAGLAAMAVLWLLLMVYAVRYSATSADHLRSFTPICSNCGLAIVATSLTEPHPRDRLRDHFKVCVS